MPRQVLLFSGASAVGKTSVLRGLLPLLVRGGMTPCVCKIDCLKTGDAEIFQGLGLLALHQTSTSSTIASSKSAQGNQSTTPEKFAGHLDRS